MMNSRNRINQGVSWGPASGRNWKTSVNAVCELRFRRRSEAVTLQEKTVKVDPQEEVVSCGAPRRGLGRTRPHYGQE